MTADDLSHYNLVVVGGALDNTLTAMIQTRLPLTIMGKSLVAGGRAPLSLEGGYYGLCYYNPLATSRLVFLLAFDDKADLKPYLEAPAALLDGAGWDTPGDAPDLVVSTPTVMRSLQFNEDWQWIKQPGDAQKVAPAFFDGRKSALAKVGVVQKVTGVDIALGDYWLPGPNDPAPVAKELTFADLRIERTPMTTLVGALTGAELKALLTANAKEMVWLAVPAIDPKTLDEGRLYRVALPPTQPGAWQA